MGLYVFSLLFALQLVIGQAFWKLAVERGNFELTTDFLLSKKVFGFVANPWLILGIVFYLSATLLNFWLLSKYQFTSIQAITIPAALVLTFIVGSVFFKDSLSTINVIGMVVIVGGVVLATLR